MAKDLLGGGTRHDAVFYASYGLTGNYISQRTGLKRGAVYYACRKAGVRITDYRNGLGNTVAVVMKLTQHAVDEELYKHLRKTL